MANTEGIPDEVLSSLFSIPSSSSSPSPSSSSSASSSITTTTNKMKDSTITTTTTAARNKSRKNRLAQRDAAMARQRQQQFQREGPKFPRNKQREQLMNDYNSSFEEGGTPAAKVIRASPPVIQTASSSSSSSSKSKQNVIKKTNTLQTEVKTEIKEEKQQEEEIPAQQVPIVKSVILSESIVERPITSPSFSSASRTTLSENDTKPSKFKASRFKAQRGGGSVPSGGFPSLNQPIGSLLKKKKKQNENKDTTTSTTSFQKKGVASTPNTKKPLFTNDDDTNNEADAMIAAMTQSEIKEGIEEITSSLSSNTIDFLKKRGLKKKQQQKNESEKTRKKEDIKKNDEKTIQMKKEQKIKQKKQQNLNNDKEEKEEELEKKVKMAKLLSNIQTEEELQTAYLDSLSSESTNHDEKEEENEKKEEEKEELTKATKLLRSTSIHQRLLGSKLLLKTLQQHYSKKQQCKRETHEEKKFSPPLLLPVALICLLDEISSSSSVLKEREVLLLDCLIRSLYILLKLIVHPLFRISVNVNKTNKKKKKCKVYQLHYMEDDVPLPSATTIYSSFQITSTTTPTKHNKNVGNSTTTTSYATNASADTASSDSKAFYKDPCWILLSRMKIIPILSNLVQKSTDKSTGCTTAATTTTKDNQTREKESDDDTAALDQKCSSSSSSNLPSETLVSLCGILSMLSLRSPGASCAIAQHVYILPILVDSTLSPLSSSNTIKDGFVVNTETAYATLTLLCTLARQSRSCTAESRVFGRVIPCLQAILAMKAECEEEWMVQRWCVVLWRILLRYGLAIPQLSTFLSLSTPHITMSQPDKYNLTTEYLTAFSNICNCAKMVTTTNNNNDDGHLVQLLSSSQKETLAMAGMWLSSHVSRCTLYLQSLQEKGEDTFSSFDKDAILSKEYSMRLASARIRLVSSYIAAAGPVDLLNEQNMTSSEEGVENDKEEEEEKRKIPKEERNNNGDSFIPVIPMSSCLESLQSLIKSGLLQYAIHLVLKHAFVIDWIDIVKTTTTAVKTANVEQDYNKNDTYLEEEEAAACALVKDCLALFSSCSNNKTIDDETKVTVALLAVDLRNIMLKSLQNHDRNKRKEEHSGIANTSTIEQDSFQNDTSDLTSIHYARIRWLNAAHFAVCKFLLSSPSSSAYSSDGIIQSESICKAFGYSLLGRLQRGDEAKAAILLSQDVLFDITKQQQFLSKTIQSPLSEHKEESQTEEVAVVEESPIQSMLLRELCATNLSQAQLDHSFKLQHGVGISSSSGKGPFSLESLRMDVDRKDPPSLSDKSKDDDDDGESLSSPVSELIVPLGKLWLWNVLSSTIRPISTNKEGGLEVISESKTFQNKSIMQEAFDVVASCLRLLLLMEEDCELKAYYAGNINPGAKLYHLFNVCLYPEDVLRDDRIVPLLVSIFDKYTSVENSGGNIETCNMETTTKHICQFFTSACFLHSRSSQVKKKTPDSIYKTETEKMTNLLNAKSNSDTNTATSRTNEIKALEDFVGDMCDAYLEYGAQYDCFTLCIRYFLSPGFPPKVIVGLIQKLRGFLHLLTVEEESKGMSGSAMIRSLHIGFSGGLPSRDGSKRDPAEILDAFALALKGDDCHLSASNGGFFYLLAVGYIARNLASSSQRCECGVQASRWRMEGLRAEVLDHIVKTAALLLLNDIGGKDALVQAVLDTCIGGKDVPSVFDMTGWPSKAYDGETWESMIGSLRNLNID